MNYGICTGHARGKVILEKCGVIGLVATEISSHKKCLPEKISARRIIIIIKEKPWNRRKTITFTIVNGEC